VKPVKQEGRLLSIITVIGAGVMGSAMSYPARDNGHEVRLVGTMLDREIIEHALQTGHHLTLKRKLPDGVAFYQLEALDKALIDTDLIIGGVNSFGVEWFASEIIPRLPEGIPVLSVTKGMLNCPDGTMMSYPRYYYETAPKGCFCAVGGPCTSYELADYDQTHVCYCGKEIDTLKMLKKTLETDYYHVSLSTDIEGLEFAVGIKNAYAMTVALAIGISLKKDGIQHYNSQAALFGQSVKEMKKLLDLFGYSSDNIVFGAGDLFVTVFGGRSRRLGILLGEGVQFEEAMKTMEGLTLEAVVMATRTATAVRTMIEKKRASERDFPLLLHIDDVINNQAPVNIPWDAFTL